MTHTVFCMRRTRYVLYKCEVCFVMKISNKNDNSIIFRCDAIKYRKFLCCDTNRQATYYYNTKFDFPVRCVVSLTHIASPLKGRQ